MSRKPQNPGHKRIPEPNIKVHPWRICIYGESPRETHPLGIRPSKKHPDGITTRHFNCEKNPDYKDVLYPHEIEYITETYFSSLSGAPKPYDFGNENGNSYDSLIRDGLNIGMKFLSQPNLLIPILLKRSFSRNQVLTQKHTVESHVV